MTNPKVNQFVTAVPQDNAAPQTILGVMELKTYLVQYKDANGKTNVRIVAVPNDADISFVFAERMHGDALAVEGTKWFNKALFEKIGRKPGEKQAKELESI